MAATTWTKFYWADWQSDHGLQRCSIGARGIWIEMLCIAARQDPIGYLGVDGESLTPSDIAHHARVSEAEAISLIAELDRNGVLTRDRNGRIYSRRMVRDARVMATAKKNGAKGGNPSLLKQKEKPPPVKGRVKPPDKLRYQNPDTSKQVARDARAPLLLACDAMGVDLERVVRKPAWMVFGDLFAELVGQGCIPELDIWPTIASVRGRSGEVPSSPRYFKAAILDARDERLAVAAPVPASAREWDERLAVFASEGVWSSKWGPKPGEDGCLAPASKRVA